MILPPMPTALGLLVLAGLPSLGAVSPAQPLPLLTRVKAIRAVPLDEAQRGYPVRFRGVVTHFDERHMSGLVVHDGEAGQYVVTDMVPPQPMTGLSRGDLVEIEGRTIRGGYAPNVQPTRLRRLGRAPLPAARRVPYSSLLTGRYDCDWIEVVGVGERAWLSDPVRRTLFLDLAVEGGTLRVSFWDYSAADIGRLIDARIRLRGSVGALFSPAEQLRGISLFAGRAADVVVEEAPWDPFSLPVRTVRSLFNYSLGGEVNRRIRLRGSVTAQVLGRPIGIADYSTASTFSFVRHVLYLEDATGATRIESEQETPVEPGAVVEVAGFPTVTATRPILRHAVFRVVAGGQEPRATAVRGEPVVGPEHDGELVQLEGELLGVVRDPTERVLVMKRGDTAFHASLATAAGSGELAEIRPGSLIGVTGVYAFQWGPPPAFRLILRSPADVVLRREAPWWTPRHTAVVLAAVALVSGVAAVWLRMVQSRNVLIRRHYQDIIGERSRLARELHDTLEQGLAGIKLQLEAVAGSVEASPRIARQSLDVARQMLQYCLDEARRAVLDLRSQALAKQDLAGALRDLACQMTTGSSLAAEVEVEGTPRRLDAAREHHVLRIGLEALTNAVKHAEARHVRIALRYGRDGVLLQVADDGHGFERGDDAQGTNFGLLGMHERADKLGGTLRIDSRPGQGTTVSLELPLRKWRGSAADAASTLQV